MNTEYGQIMSVAELCDLLAQPHVRYVLIGFHVGRDIRWLDIRKSQVLFQLRRDATSGTVNLTVTTEVAPGGGMQVKLLMPRLPEVQPKKNK